MGWWDIRKGNLARAKEALKRADAIYRKAGLLVDLCRLEWVWGMLAAAEGDYQGGKRCANESLTISSDTGMMLWKADGLCLRGRLKLLQLEKEGGVSLLGVDGVNPSGFHNKRLKPELLTLLEGAADDEQEALRIADATGYIWAKLEALELLTRCHQAKIELSPQDREAHQDAARSYAHEEAAIRGKLTLTPREIVAIREQARKEFEKETAARD